MGRKKMGKQILKRERERRREEERKEETFIAASKQSESIWNSIWDSLSKSNHKFKVKHPHGLDKCVMCELTVSQIMEMSEGIGYLLTCCPRCKGKGEIMMERYEMNCPLCGFKRMIDKKEICSKCQGVGCAECKSTGREDGEKNDG